MMEKLEKEYLQTQGAIHFVADDRLIGLLAPEPQSSLDDHPRLRIWEIQERFKCPFIGWRFDITEQKEVLRKEGISIKEKSNFGIHEIVVDSLENENRVSRRIDF